MLTYRNLGNCGRLGNALWEIASTLGIAASRGEEAIFPRWDYAPYFHVPEHLFGDVMPSAVEATEFVPHMDYRAKPYLQDWNLFSGIEETIRNYFKPSHLAMETIDDPKFDWFHLLDDPIAVHIRRGDNVTHPLGIHPLRSIQYYQDALQVVRADLDEEHPVVVFSDDIEWCKETLGKAFKHSTGGGIYYMEGNPQRPQEHLPEFRGSLPMDWVDLQFMALCRYHIIANSTYSWWGAFLSDNPHPVYPSNWFGWQLKYINADLMFPPNWQRVFDATQGGVKR